MILTLLASWLFQGRQCPFNFQFSQLHEVRMLVFVGYNKVV